MTELNKILFSDFQNKTSGIDYSKLYPTYQTFIKPDRRQNEQPVENDRRSGIDRREDKDRFVLDTGVKKDIDKVKDVVISVSSVIPFIRKYEGIKSAFESGDVLKGCGKTFLQFITIRDDSSDIHTACEQITSHNFKAREWQRPFGFIRDSFLYDIKFFRQLRKYDKTLYDFDFSDKILTKLGAGKPIFEGERIKFTGSLPSKIVARTFTRIPLLSLLFLGLLEMPEIIKAKNKKEQVKKATINTIGAVCLSALFGAIGAMSLGMIGSLAGISLGLFVGNKLGNSGN